MKPNLLVAFVFGIAVGVASCGGDVARGGSESHFLESCTENSCGELSCVCGVCTRLCSDASTCEGLLSGTSCVELADLPQGSECTTTSRVQQVCDVACTSDAECMHRNAKLRCEQGVCRATQPLSTDTQGHVLAITNGDLSYVYSHFYRALEGSRGCETVFSSPECYLLQCAPTLFEPVSGGTITIESNRTVELPAETADGTWSGEALWEPGEFVRFNIAGDPEGAPAFESSVIGPGPVELVRSNIGKTVTRTAPLEMEWKSDTVGEVIVSIHGDEFHLMCSWPASAGIGVISPAALSLVPAGSKRLQVDRVSTWFQMIDGWFMSTYAQAPITGRELLPESITLE